MIMIPWVVARYGSHVARIAGWAIIGLIALAILAALYLAVCSFFTAPLEKQMKVNAAQASAQSDSAHDAIRAIGNTTEAGQAYDTLTRENANAIDNAKGADASVDPAARATGVHALCRRKAYRDAHPACLRPAAPR